VAVLVVGWACPRFVTPATAQAGDRGEFTLLSGADTYAVERFTRTPNRLESELRGPSLGRIQISAVIDPDESVPELTLRFWPVDAAEGDPPNQSATITMRQDTAVIAITSPPGINPQPLSSARDAFVYMNPSFALMEQMIRRARAAGGASASFPVFLAEGGETANVSILNATTDAVTVILGPIIDVVMDAEGHLLSASLQGQNLHVVRSDFP
jgi:hypothetical protein